MNADNALMEQKDRLYQTLNEIDVDRCVDAETVSDAYTRLEGVYETLSFVKTLWGALGYGYKGREIAERIKQILWRIEDERMPTQRKRGDRLRKNSQALIDEFHRLQQVYISV